jgi:hypothetical protein
MREDARFYQVGHCVLALSLLIANVVAPFQTATGRTLIDYSSRNARPQSVARVRAQTQSGCSHCFRAVVGLASGGSGEALAAPAGLANVATRSSSHILRSDAAIEPRCTLPRPPLRC